MGSQKRAPALGRLGGIFGAAELSDHFGTSCVVEEDQSYEMVTIQDEELVGRRVGMDGEDNRHEGLQIRRAVSVLSIITTRSADPII